MTKETAVYTHGHDESVLRSHRWRTAENSAAYLLPELHGGVDLLDIGCGPGTLTADLAARVAPGRVLGVDHSADVLPSARAVVAERGLDQVKFAQGDVHALDLPDDSFDVVHAHQVLQHVSDPVAALREMRRVCRPGGLLAVRESDYAAMHWYPQAPGLTEWQRLYRDVARAGDGEPDAGRRLLSWALAAGLDQGGTLTPSASAWCFATPGDRRWWSSLWADRTLTSHYTGLVTGGGFATKAALEEIAQEWRAWGEHPQGWFSVPHGELLCRF